MQINLFLFLCKELYGKLTLNLAISWSRHLKINAGDECEGTEIFKNKFMMDTGPPQNGNFLRCHERPSNLTCMTGTKATVTQKGSQEEKAAHPVPVRSPREPQSRVAGVDKWPGGSQAHPETPAPPKAREHQWDVSNDA